MRPTLLMHSLTAWIGLALAGLALASPPQSPIGPGTGAGDVAALTLQRRPITHVVVIDDFGYNLRGITIHAGDSVIWKNRSRGTSRAQSIGVDDPDRTARGLPSMSFDTGEIRPFGNSLPKVFVSQPDFPNGYRIVYWNGVSSEFSGVVHVLPLIP